MREEDNMSEDEFEEDLDLDALDDSEEDQLFIFDLFFICFFIDFLFLLMYVFELSRILKQEFLKRV